MQCYPCVSHIRSLGHLIKHLPGSKSHSFVRSRFHSTTTTSCFKSLSSTQQNQIYLYVDTLLQWNQKMNLTATKEAEQVMERHIEDSLAILPPVKNCYNDLFDHISLIDVGSGAGLPGLVLAIACPDWRVTLLESINKRCVFLEHVVDVTGITNVKIVRDRAESCGHDVMYREKFDVAIARAVAEMRVLAEYRLPLVRIGGLFVAAKGHDPKGPRFRAQRINKTLDFGELTLPLFWLFLIFIELKEIRWSYLPLLQCRKTWKIWESCFNGSL